MTNEPTFTLDESIAVQKHLRAALNMKPEQFAMPEFVQMLGDEIEKLHAAGKSDADIADMVRDVTGKTIDPGAIARNLQPHDERHAG